MERLSEHGDYHLFDNGMAKMIRIRVEMKSQRGESVRMRGSLDPFEGSDDRLLVLLASSRTRLSSIR